MRGLGALLIVGGLIVALLMYTKSTGSVIGALFNAPQP